MKKEPEKNTQKLTSELSRKRLKQWKEVNAHKRVVILVIRALHSQSIDPTFDTSLAHLIFCLE